MAKINQKSEKKFSTRRMLQLTALILTLLVGLRHILPGESSRGGAFDSFCPFGGVETLWSYLSTGGTLHTTNLLNFSILLGVLGMAMLSGRSFCGWICPLGTVQDYIHNLKYRLLPAQQERLSLPKQQPGKINLNSVQQQKLRYLKYFILAAVIGFSVWTVYPPLHSICPARALFSFQLTTPLLWLVLVLFVISSLLVERFSCRYLCPLGAVLAPFNKISPLRLTANRDKCSGCGQCSSECPMNIQDIPSNLRSSECIQCLNCQDSCPVDDLLILRLG